MIPVLTQKHHAPDLPNLPSCNQPCLQCLAKEGGQAVFLEIRSRKLSQSLMMLSARNLHSAENPVSRRLCTELLSVLPPALTLCVGTLVHDGQPCGDCPTADKRVQLD